MGYSHVYLTAHGEFTAAPWIGEIAQIGLRVSRWALGNTNPVIQLPNLTDFNASFSEYEDSTFRVTQMFDSDEDISLAHQANTMDLVQDFHWFLTSCRAHQWSSFRWTHIKAALIEHGTGKYLTPGSVYEFLTPLAGTAQGPLPPEVAVALSWRTAVVGKRGRGRMYLPALVTGDLDGSGTVTSSKRTAMTTAMKQLHDDLANMPGIDVYSSGIVVCSGNSTSAVIPREARVGNHFDVQRRRQHQVEEQYTTVPLT